MQPCFEYKKAQTHATAAAATGILTGLVRVPDNIFDLFSLVRSGSASGHAQGLRLGRVATRWVPSLSPPSRP